MADAEIVACPGCGGRDGARVKGVWWTVLGGGKLLVAALKLAKCPGCGSVFNAHSGKDWTKQGPLVWFALPLVALSTVLTIMKIARLL